MNQPQLTHLINRKIDLLKLRMKSAPQGGDFNSLRVFLKELQRSTQRFLNFLDKLEKVD